MSLADATAPAVRDQTGNGAAIHQPSNGAAIHQLGNGAAIHQPGNGAALGTTTTGPLAAQTEDDESGRIVVDLRDVADVVQDGGAACGLFDHLPDELAARCLAVLPFVDVVTVSRVCGAWHARPRGNPSTGRHESRRRRDYSAEASRGGAAAGTWIYQRRQVAAAPRNADRSEETSRDAAAAAT